MQTRSPEVGAISSVRRKRRPPNGRTLARRAPLGQGPVLPVERGPRGRLTCHPAIEDVRDPIADLQPKVLDDFGLGPALERLCSTVARRSGLAVQAELGEGLDALPPDVATAVYRIVQEAMSNVVRHAEARTVGVTAAILDDDVLVATVSDDGVGFRPGSMGHGIEGMLDRARMVTGRVDLESPAGGGAGVRFELQIGSS